MERLAIRWPGMEAGDAGAWADAADVVADAVAAARQEWARAEGRRLALNRRLAAKLDRIGRGDLAGRVAACHAVGSVGITADGRERMYADRYCHVRRLCAWCARDEAARRARVLRPVLVDAARRYRIQFATFTVENAPMGTLEARVATLLRALERLRHRAVWRRVVRAAAMTVESTWHGTEGCTCGHGGTYHVHVHMLVARPRYDGSSGTDLDWRALDAAWHELTGGTPIDWEDVDGEAAAVEMTKYVSKLTAERSAPKPGACPATGGGVLDMPDEAFAEWVGVFGAPHRRWWRTYGEWFRLGRELDAPEGEPAPETPDREAEPAAEVLRLTWEPDAEGGTRLGVFIQPNNSACAAWSAWSCTWTPADIVAAITRWLQRREARRIARRRRRMQRERLRRAGRRRVAA